jgi:hypothetical protein
MVGLILLRIVPTSEYIQKLGSFGYLGVACAGILVTYTITSSIGVLLLFAFSHVLPIVPLAFVASTGMSLAEYIIFRTSQYTVSSMSKKTSSRYLKKIPKWFLKKNNYVGLVMFGIVLLLLPLPYEFAMSVLGVTKITTVQFVIFTYILNVVSVIIVLHFFAPIFHFS